MTIHETQIPHYELRELAIKIGDLRYDALADFLAALAHKIEQDAQKDEARRRIKLASNLYHTAQGLTECSQHIERAWVICEPHM